MLLSCVFLTAIFVNQPLNDLLRHKKNRDNPDGFGKFACSICDKITCHRKLLMAHIKGKHGRNKEFSEHYRSSTDCEGIPNDATKGGLEKA